MSSVAKRRSRSQRPAIKGMLAGSCSMVAVLVAINGFAADQAAVAFNIKAGDLASALNQFAQQSDQQIFFPTEVTRNKQARAIEGSYQPDKALDLLLQGTGLGHKSGDNGTILITGDSGAAPPMPTAPEGSGAHPMQAAAAVSRETTAARRSEEKSPGLEELVVTAQKRAEPLQSVAMSVSAFSGERLAQLGVSNVFQLTEMIPNVSYTGEGSVDQVNIRGVQLNDFGDGNEPPVGIYVDEVYYGTLAGHQAQLFDTERVEVLRGPQGTLFGRNTVGGLVHTITRGPTKKLEGYGSVQLGSYGQEIFEGAISGPLSDRFRARLAFRRDQDHGWQKNEVLSGVLKTARTDNFAGRVSVDYDASDDLQISFSAHGLDQTSTPEMYEVLGTFVPGTAASGRPVFCAPDVVRAGLCQSISIFGPAAGTFISGTPDPHRAFTDLRDPKFNIHSYGGWGKIHWDIGSVKFVSITAYESVRKRYDNDPDGPRPEIHGDFRISAHQWSEELRLTGEFARFHWVVGAFYYKDRKFDWSFATPELVQIFGTTFTTQNQMTLDTESYAAFAQSDFDITDALKLTTGARWSHETKDLVITDSFAAPHYTDNEQSRASKATWRAGLDWKAASDVLLYGNVATGFKSGAFNTQLVGPGGSTPSKPEEITTYEIGAKTEWLERRLRLNVAGFVNDYRSVQAAITTNVNNVPVVRNVNVGKLNTKGVEIETVALPTRNLEIDISAGWIHGKYQANDPSQLIGDRNIPLNGAIPPHTPKFNFKMLAQYRIELGAAGGVLLQMNGTWEDKVFLNVVNDPYLTQKANWIWDARASWLSESEQYEVSFFVNNFTDTKSVSGGFMQGGLGLLSLEWKPPRLMGAKFTAKF